jgi:hypothetical protein
MLSIESQFGPSGGSGSPGQSQTDGGDAGEALDRVTEELGSIRRELSSGKLRSFRGMQEALKGDDGQGRAALTSNTPETATDIQRLEVDFRPLYDARAKKVMGMRPLWLSDLVKDLTRARMKKLPRYRRIENLRAINSVRIARAIHTCASSHKSTRILLNFSICVYMYISTRTHINPRLRFQHQIRV